MKKNNKKILMLFCLILFTGCSQISQNNLTVGTEGSKAVNKGINLQYNIEKQFIAGINKKILEHFNQQNLTDNLKAPASLSNNTPVVQYVPNGYPVNQEDFKDAVSPSNIKGNYATAESFSRYVDVVPATGQNYIPTLNSVETVYGNIVNYAKSNDSLVNSILQKNRTFYNTNAFPSLLIGFPDWHLSYAEPGNWYLDDADIFTDITLSINNTDIISNDDTTDIIKNGIWSIWTDDLNKVSNHLEAKNISIKFKLSNVKVNRPWLDNSVFNMKNWSLGDSFPKGSISSGQYTDIQNSIMPIIPQIFYIARDVEITAEWSNNDKISIEKMLNNSSNLKVGMGMFRLKQPELNNKATLITTFQNGTITVKGLQIIAWVSNVVPLSPPE